MIQPLSNRRPILSSSLSFLLDCRTPLHPSVSPPIIPFSGPLLIHMDSHNSPFIIASSRRMSQTMIKPCIMGCGWTCDSKNWAFAASDSPRARLSGDISRTSPGNNLLPLPTPRRERGFLISLFYGNATLWEQRII